LALQNEQQAREQFELAFEALDYFVEGAQNTMANDPSLRPLQRQLLEKAAEDLLRLTKRFDSTRPDVSRAAALARTGGLLQLLGRRGEARPQLELAQQLADDVLAGEPDNTRAQYVWCKAASGLAALAVLERKYDECKKLERAAISRAEGLLRRNPDDSGAHKILYLGCATLASAHLVCGEKAEARRWARRSLEATPADLKNHPSAALTWFTLG